MEYDDKDEHEHFSKLMQAILCAFSYIKHKQLLRFSDKMYVKQFVCTRSIILIMLLDAKLLIRKFLSRYREIQIQEPSLASHVKVSAHLAK